MAKRNNNNSAGRRSYGEKPYDVNNSFVKKMATRVTDLMPQRSWISKWFNSPGGNGLADQDTEEQDVEEEFLQPPSKRPCIQLDVTHPSDTFRIQSRNRISNNINVNINANANSNHNINYTAVAHTINSNEQYEDADESMACFPQPIAGSSRSFVASTPTLRILGRLTHTKSDITPLVHHQQQQQQQQQDANGADDNSESSESTSGCSSLIPQTSRQDGLSNFIIYPFASNKKLISDNNKLSFTNHLQSKSLLFNGRDSLSSRRPSFNASMVSNDNSPLERAAGLSSPFYSGNTTFGGANAIGNFRAARRPGQINDFQLRVPKRSSVRVKPSSSSSTTDVTGMSQTAKRILETLEHFSSPITDAKKIPVKTSMSTFASRKRAREEESNVGSAMAPIGLRHLTRELAVPTVPDMLKLKRRQRLTNTTLAARKIISAHSEPAPQVKPAEYHLRTESEDKKFMGKLRAKGKKKIDIEEPAEEFNLAHIPLPITTLPSFDIPISEARNNSNSNSNFITTSSSSSIVINNNNINKTGTSGPETKRISPSKETGSFKFSSPIKLDGANTSLESDGQQFTFSQPINLNQESSPKQNSPVSLNFTSKPNFNFNSTAISQPSTNFLWSGSSTAPRPKERKVSETKQVEIQAGSVMEVFAKKADNKSEVQIWECRECFIKNNDSNDQCVACKARKSDSKISVSSSSSSSSVDASEGQQFGIEFKLNDKWECEACLVRNPAAEANCLSCSTQRQDKRNSKITSKSFSNFSSKIEAVKPDTKDKAKPVDGTWECPGCMLKNPSNVITCPCCNASKPGLVKTAKNSLPMMKIQQNTAKKWECPACMVRNELTASSCVCCETPCPNKSSKSSTETKSPAAQPSTLTTPITSGFGDKFKKPPGAWTCDACMVQNKAEVIECVSCSTLKPGATKKEEEKKTETPTFTFGIPAGAQPSAVKSDEKKSDGATNGFTFAPPTSQPFTFGIPKTSTETPEPTSFKFSSPMTMAPKEIPSSGPASGFTFGVPKIGEKVKDKVEEKSPVFSFGAPKVVEKHKSIVFSNPLANSQEKSDKTTPGFSFVSPEAVASASYDAGESLTVFTFSEPKKLNTPAAEAVKFGQNQPVAVPVTTSSGFSFTSPKFADSSAPPEKKAAIAFGSSATAPVFGLNSAAKPEEKSSPFEIPDKSKTPFALEKKSGGFGEEKKTTESTFGSDKPIFNTGSTAPAFGSVPTTSSSSLFATGATPSSIFGTGASNFGTPSAANIFSAVKPAETPAPAANNQGLFSFGATAAQNTQNSVGGFNFSGGNNATQKPMFSFGSNSVATPAPTAIPTPTPAGETGFGTSFGSSATNQPSAFSFNAPKADPPAFGQPSATPLPSIFNNQASGSLGQTAGSNNMFNFGSSAPATGSSTASGSTGFNFNAGLNASAAPSAGFKFNAMPPSPAIAFDPNTPPTFNFTGGSSVAQFSAAPQQAVTQRKIKRAVRRVHPRT